MAKTVSLVLGSGGARGYVHVGVIDELLKRGYQINCIAGCSMGALIGGVFAAGRLEEFRSWVLDLGYFDMLRLADVSFGSMGAMRGDKLFDAFDDVIGDMPIEDLPIHFTAVATDLNTQQELWFQRGSLKKAIRASIAIPTLFTPVIDRQRVLVDGGLLNPLPIAPVVSAHSDLIIAVDLSGENGTYTLPSIQQGLEDSRKKRVFARWMARIVGPSSKEQTGESKGGMLSIVNQCFETMQGALSQYKAAGYPPDLMIKVPKDICRFYEFQLGPELMELGREIASDALDRFETAGNSEHTHESDDGSAGGL